MKLYSARRTPHPSGAPASPHRHAIRSRWSIPTHAAGCHAQWSAPNRVPRRASRACGASSAGWRAEASRPSPGCRPRSPRQLSGKAPQDAPQPGGGDAGRAVWIDATYSSQIHLSFRSKLGHAADSKPPVTGSTFLRIGGLSKTHILR